MLVSFDQALDDMLNHGFAMLKRVFSDHEVGSLVRCLSTALESNNEAAVLRTRGQTYGSRNLIAAIPEVCSLFDSTSLREFAATVLPENAGVVRALYFDKPPGQSWSLPWHRDRTIAVKRNDLESQWFLKPTVKAGVPHVEAPEWLLRRMLTFRIHLDEMNAENGPLCVIPGSHLDNREPPSDQLELHAQAGDVLAMRPLLSHSSKMSKPNVAAHRRIIHIELAEDVALPDGYQWNWFVPLSA